MFRHFASLAVAAVVACTAYNASAAVLAEYNFGTATPNGAGGFTFVSYTSASAKDANVNAADALNGPGSAWLNQNGFNYSTPPFRAINRTAAVSTDNSGYYASIVVSAAPGYQLNLSSFTFTGAAGGGLANERSFAVYADTDGTTDQFLAPGTTDINSGSFRSNGSFALVRPASASANTTMPTFGTDLNLAAYQGVSSVEVRVYFRTVNNGQNIDIDNLVLNGTATIVPEPAALGVLGLGGLALLRRRRA